jgi:flagellar biogenesis protein FliO
MWECASHDPPLFSKNTSGNEPGAQVMKQMTSNEKVIAIGSSLLLLLALIFFIAAFLLSR